MAGRPYGDLFRTKLCKFFEENGNCPRGDRCTFAHGKHELREAPNYAGDDRRRRFSPRRDDREEYERRDDYRRSTRSMDRGRRSRSPSRRHSRNSRSPQPDREERDRERRRSRHRSSERDREGDTHMSSGRKPRSPERAEDRERSPSKSPPRDAAEDRAVPAAGDGDGAERDAGSQQVQAEAPNGAVAEEPRSRHEKRERSPRSPSRKRSKSRRDDDKKVSDLENQVSRLASQLEHQKKKNLDVMEELKEYENDKRKAEEEAEEARRHADELQAKLTNALTDCGTREGRFKKYIPMVQNMLDRLKEDIRTFGEKDPTSERVTVSAVRASILASEELQNLQIGELQELEHMYWRALRNISSLKDQKIHQFGLQKQLKLGTAD